MRDEPRQDMSDSDLIARIEDELRHSLGNDGDELAGNEERALDYYFGKYPLKPTDAPNRSGVVSKDIEDAIDATVAQIMPAFSSPDLGQFEPENQDDEDKTAQESEYINWLLFEKHPGRDIIKTALTDCLMQRNATTRAWIDKHVEVTYDELSEVGAEQLSEALSQEGTEILEQSEDIKTVPTEMGPMQVPVYSVKLKRTAISKTIRIDPIPPEHRAINADQKSLNLQESRFFATKTRMMESELYAHGVPYDVIDTLQEGDTLRDTRDYARSRDSKERDQWTHGEGNTRSKLVYDIFMRVDFDQDGYAERRHILYSNGTVLINEPYKYVLVAGGACYTVPHRWMGRSFYDKLKDIQEVKTELVRQTLEAGRININQRLGAVREEVDPDSLLESRTGGTVWADGPNSIWALPPTQLPPESWQLLEYQDKMRRERGGGAIDQAGQAQQVGGDTAHGYERAVTLLEQLNAEAAREFSESFLKQLYLLLHHLVREFSEEQVSYKKNGEWKQTDPRQWPERERVTIDIGMTEGERMRRRAVLEGVYAKQKEIMAGGMDGVLVDLNGIYNTLADICRASYISEPLEYWINPASPESQQAQQQKAQQSQEQAQQQQQMAAAQTQMQATVAQAELGKSQAMQAKVQVQGQLDYLKQELERIKTVADSEDTGKQLMYQYDKLFADTAIKLTEIEAGLQQPQNQNYRQNYETVQ